MILLLLVLIRLPALLFDYPLIIPELIWDITGQKLAEGNVMFRDIRETTGPLAAGTYFLVNLFFKDTHFAYQVLSLILVILQAIIFNHIVNVHNLFAERTFVPALLYGVFSSIFFDFFTLSTVMLGMTFIILAFHFVLIVIRTGDRDEEIFYTGIFAGLASLFYFPLFIFLLLIILVFLLFTPVNLRKYFVLLTAHVFPLLLCGTYYFLRDGLDEFIESYFFPLFTDMEYFLSLRGFLTVLIVPASLLVISIATIAMASRYVNFQYVAIRIFGLWIFFAAATVYLSSRLSLYHAFVFIPVFVFFGTHFFLLLKHRIIRELSFIVIFILVLLINYGTLYGFAFRKNPIVIDGLLVKKPEGFDIKNSRIVVFGEEKSFYKDNMLATPYFNWKLSEKELKNTNSYEGVSEIYRNFKKDLPDLILDSKNITENIFGKIPELEGMYEKRGTIGEYEMYYKK
jgi:hypothetical protein